MLLEDLSCCWKTFLEIPKKVPGHLPHPTAIKLHTRITFIGIYLANKIVFFQKIFASFPWWVLAQWVGWEVLSKV